MNEQTDYTGGPQMVSPLDRIRQIGAERDQRPNLQDIEAAILATSDIDARRANAVNVVLHAKGVLATVTPAEAASIWLIANTLDTVSG